MVTSLVGSWKNDAMVSRTSLLALLSFAWERTLMSIRFLQGLYPAGNKVDEEPGSTWSWSSIPSLVSCTASLNDVIIRKQWLFWCEFQDSLSDITVCFL